MRSMIVLEWLVGGEWHPIGWDATNPESISALRTHGQRLADQGGEYRMVAFPTETVVHTFAAN